MKRSKGLQSALQMFLDPLRTRRVEDLGTLAQARVLHGLVILDVVQPQDFGAIREIVRLLRKPDDDAYLGAFDALDDALVGGLHESLPYTDFCRFLKSKTPAWLHSLVDAITSSDEYDARLTVKNLRQLNFILRVTRAGSEKPYAGLLETNASRDHTPSPRLRELGQDLVNDPQFIAAFVTNFRPGHGPGSTAFEAAGRFKTRAGCAVDKDPKVDTERLRNYVENTPFKGWFDHYPTTSARRESPSIIRAVPKNWKKMRLIAIEDTTRMYLQQGVFHSLKAAIGASALTKNHIDLSRAYLNAEEARRGSIFRDVDTLDLSSASDSVGKKFVQELFGDTWLWTTLETCSTHAFDVEGEQVASRIFATMGNAVCFPVMTIILSLACREAEEACGVPHRHRCYGDDITIDSRATKTLVENLTSYGFTVNTDKSFCGSTPFRESCGGEYVDGVDVEPIRISRKFATLDLEQEQSIEEIEKLRALYNRLFTDFPWTRDFLARILTKDFALNFPRTCDGTIGLKVAEHAFRNWVDRAGVRFDSGLQASYVECDTIASKLKRRTRKGAFALAEWLIRRNADDCDIDVLSTALEYITPFFKDAASEVLADVEENISLQVAERRSRRKTLEMREGGWEPLIASTSTSRGAVHLAKARYYYLEPRHVDALPTR